jgi:hypothetical protein
MASEQRCVVCGMGSHREDWAKTSTVKGVKYVACDGHDQKVVDVAAAKAAGVAPTPTPKPVAARVPGEKPVVVSNPVVAAPKEFPAPKTSATLTVPAKPSDPTKI